MDVQSSELLCVKRRSLSAVLTVYKVIVRHKELTENINSPIQYTKIYIHTYILVFFLCLVCSRAQDISVMLVAIRWLNMCKLSLMSSFPNKTLLALTLIESCPEVFMRRDTCCWIPNGKRVT